MSALIALLDEEALQGMWRDYIAVCTHTAAQMAAEARGKKLTIPLWVELAYPERKKPKDERSAAEIKRDIIKAMIGGESV